MILYGWIRDEVNIVEGYVYGMCSGAEADSDCFDLRAGAAAMGNPIPKSLLYSSV